MFAVVVTFRIKPEAIEAFGPLMAENATASLNKEPGCHRFDVCTDPERPEEVFLYELYTDADAFQAHLGSAHFLAYDAEVTDMIETKEVRTYTQVAP